MREEERPFGRTLEELPNCRLQLGINVDDAEMLGAMLETIDPWRRLGVTGRTLTTYLRREDPALKRYAVLVDAALAGLVCVRHPWLRGPYIELLGLAAAYQGRRLGSEILAWAEQEARREARNLWVVTSASNTPARRFYARHGFVEIGPIMGLVAPDQAEILLRKSWD